MAPKLTLAGVEGGGVDVHDELGPGAALDLGGTHRVPDVLADVHPDADAVDDEDGAVLAGAEIAVLVEDAVVGEEHLVVDAHQLAVGANGGGVEDVAVSIGEAHHYGDLLGGLHHLAHGLDVALDEVGLEEEVLRRIAGDDELGEGHQVGAQLPGAGHEVKNPGGVALQVAHGGVDLGHGQAQGAHGESIA